MSVVRDVDPNEVPDLPALASVPLDDGRRWSPRVGQKPTHQPMHQSRLRFRTAREIAEATPERPDWTVEGLAVAGGITELDGKAKLAGKSTCLGFMAAAILDRKPFLGRTTKQGPIVWLTEENDPAFRQMLERCGLTDRDDLYVLRYVDTIGTDWPAVMQMTRDKAREVSAIAMVIDTLPRFAGLSGDDENSSGAALAAMDHVLFAAGDGLAVIVSRHDRRAGGEVGESGRGSTAFTGAVDIVLHISRLGGEGRDKIRQLDGIGRFEGIPDRLVIELGDSGYVVRGSVIDLKTAEAKAQLLAALPTERGDAIGLPKLWAEEGPLHGLDIHPNTFRLAAKQLEAAQILEKVVISAKEHRWYVSNAPAGTGHSGPKPAEASSVGEHVYSAPSLKGTVYTQHAAAGGNKPPRAHHDISGSVCPSCGETDYFPLGDGRRLCLRLDCGGVWG